MQEKSTHLTYEVELGPGERLTLPQSLLESVGPGHWVVSIRSVSGISRSREHTAFLHSYGPEDEGLYDDCAAR